MTAAAARKRLSRSASHIQGSGTGRCYTAWTSAQSIGYGQVLGERQFAFLAVAHTVSLLGSTMATVALAVLVFQRTSSALLSALTFTVSFTPYLVGGLLASRLEPRQPCGYL